MELKRLHDATLRKEYLSESDLSKYMYAHAQDFIELIDAAKAIMRYPGIREYVGTEIANKVQDSIKPFEGDK